VKTEKTLTEIKEASRAEEEIEPMYKQDKFTIIF